MFGSELPRLYELKDSIGDSPTPNAYFGNFESAISSSAHVRDVYTRLEQVLQVMDEVSWEHLKSEACKRIELRDSHGRGWTQLFDILNEARAYRYLKLIGGEAIRFIPRARTKTPDLECKLGSTHLLCEVKTINISDDEVAARSGPPKARTLDVRLSEGFLGKLRATVEAARQQLMDYDPANACERVVYINVHFDDFLAECKESYFKQIDAELSKSPAQDLGLVFCNDYTAFYRPLQMRFAKVDNLGGFGHIAD